MADLRGKCSLVHKEFSGNRSRNTIFGWKNLQLDYHSVAKSRYIGDLFLGDEAKIVASTYRTMVLDFYLHGGWRREMIITTYDDDLNCLECSEPEPNLVMDVKKCLTKKKTKKKQKLYPGGGKEKRKKVVIIGRRKVGC